MMKKILKSHLTKFICTMLILGVMVSHDKIKFEADPVEDIAPHVVSWNIITRNNQRFATGFHLKYKGEVFIVTNKHVCDSNVKNVNSKYIQFEDYVGEIIAIDDLHDLCLVTSNRDDGLELANKPNEEMDEIILVGFPRGIGKTIRFGHIIEMQTEYIPWIGAVANFYQVSTMAYGGNSGSPVCDIYGDVVGVLFAGSPAYPSEPFIVPWIDLVMFLERNV